ncbi:hypothetical protein B0H65DRAFT_507678 [Neurospora tetraspora]|uniref:Uncharacterized protein n=1 Tax=Neurospora tetraspora TaxID=94610 RepID=A0AAE0JGT9_9PEZI|nr:hypothetical protein B0H65DRAFT_507678 [Neurospora tetraspora]
MALRLQCNDYIIHLAAWAGDGFKEGVSLTVYDELIYKGPFTPLFRRFLFSRIRLTSKITIISYTGTYYAIGAAWILTSCNYFLMGWFNGYLDKYYIDSWQVWFSIILVFNAFMRYRAGKSNIATSMVENFKWTMMLAIILGGLSFHVSQALLAHMFEIDMMWGATIKEAEFSNFWIEVPKVVKKVSITFMVTMIVLAALVFRAVSRLQSVVATSM